MNFFRRHKNKFIGLGIVSAIGAGGIYLLNKYVDHKLSEAKEAENKQLTKQKQFETTGKIAEKTLENSLFPALKKTLDQVFDTEHTLKVLKTDLKNLEVWQQLKNQVFAKCSALIFCCVLLENLVKIQLQILAGYNVQNNNQISSKTQETFLNLCQIFVDKTVKNWAENEMKIELILEDLTDLTQVLSVTKIYEIFQEISKSFKLNFCSLLVKGNDLKWEELTKEESNSLKALIMDLMDLIEHKDFESVTDFGLNSNLTHFLDQIAEELNTEIFVETKGLPLAKWIPKLDKTYNSFEPKPNSKLQIFQGNIFESFCLKQ